MKREHLSRLIAPMLVLLAFMVPLGHGFTDDGYIHIQYARNIIERGEYSFNSGEISFGTTSPLWVLELAAVGSVFDDREALVQISRVLSWGAGFGALIALFYLTLALGGSRRIAGLATLTYASDAWFARWTALSMETSSAVLAMTLVALAATRAYSDRRAAALAGALLAVAALLRPEVYLAVVVAGAAAITIWRTANWRCVATMLIVAGLLLVPWLLFAKFYIGSFLPNTAGAKSGGFGIDPISLVRRFYPIIGIIGSTQGLLLVLALSSAFVLRARSVVLSVGARFAVLWSIALPLAYVVFDIQILSRYLLLITPCICAVGWVAAEQLFARMLRDSAARTAAITLALLMVVVNGVFYAKVVIGPSRAFSSDLTHNMKSIGVWLAENTAEDDVVAAADIGYLAFYSGRRVLDLGGLVEPETGILRSEYSYEEIMDRALYFDVRGYPRVDYVIDRVLVPSRFDGQVINGYQFDQVYMTTVRNLGIRMPGPFYYTLYKVTPKEP